MMKIKNFVDLMTGEFDNKEQFICTTYKYSLQ